MAEEWSANTFSVTAEQRCLLQYQPQDHRLVPPSPGRSHWDFKLIMWMEAHELMNSRLPSRLNLTPPGKGGGMRGLGQRLSRD